jgi:hypothetical protein
MRKTPGFLEKGEGIISALYALLLLMVVFFVGMDFAGYLTTSWKLRNACSETLTLMKIENGFDYRTEQAFKEYLSLLGLDSSVAEVKGTPKLVQRGEVVWIRAKIPYIVRSLKPFNRELQLEIIVELSGLAQDFVR